MKPGFPITIRAFNLSKPGEDIPGETVKLVDQLLDAGHKPGRLTADRGYFANASVDQLHRPMRDRGLAVVFDLKKDELGKKDGGQDGTIYVEGEHLCPATPQGLVDASKRAIDEEFDEDTYRRLVKERGLYATRNKEKPNEDGSVKKMCPAYGPQARVECPLRELHPNASKKPKPRVLKKNLPSKPDLICTQTSVLIKETDDTLKYAQAYRYQSPEWAETYKFDRNSVEGINGYIKDDAHEALDAAKRRLPRGMAAQQLLVTMLVVSVNLRKLAAFLSEEGREIFHKLERRYPQSRKRDYAGYGTYKRKWGPRPDDVIVEGRTEPLRT